MIHLHKGIARTANTNPQTCKTVTQLEVTPSFPRVAKVDTFLTTELVRLATHSLLTHVTRSLVSGKYPNQELCNIFTHFAPHPILRTSYVAVWKWSVCWKFHIIKTNSFSFSFLLSSPCDINKPKFQLLYISIANNLCAFCLSKLNPPKNDGCTLIQTISRLRNFGKKTNSTQIIALSQHRFPNCLVLRRTLDKTIINPETNHHRIEPKNKTKNTILKTDTHPRNNLHGYVTTIGPTYCRIRSFKPFLLSLFECENGG